MASLQWVFEDGLNGFYSLVYVALPTAGGDWYASLMIVNGRAPLPYEETTRRIGVVPAADVDAATMRIRTLDNVRWFNAPAVDPPPVQPCLF